MDGAGDRVSRCWKEFRLSQGALKEDPEPVRADLQRRPTALSLCVFLALPADAPLLHVFSLAGAGDGGSPEFPFVGWGGQETRRRRTKGEGAEASQQGGPPLAQLPGPGPEQGAACPTPFPPPAPQGSLAAEFASWTPAKPNSCQGERKKHFRAERPLWALAEA